MSPNTSQNDKHETPHQSISGNEQSLTRVLYNSSPRQSDQKRSNGTNSDSYIPLAGLKRYSNGQVHASGTMRFQNKEQQKTVSTSQHQSSQTNPIINSELLSSNSVSGVYSQSPDPVHVPSPDSESAGIVGAIHREVGVVGSRRQSSAANLSTSNNSIATPLFGKSISSETVPSSNEVVKTMTNQLNRLAGPVPALPIPTMNRAFYNTNKLRQPSFSHQKVVHANMEWKPKSSQKTNNASSVVSCSDSLSSSGAGDSGCASVMEVGGLSEKLSQINIENQHVIIPQHLLVPESERSQLTFGSFGFTFESDGELRVFNNTQQSVDEPSVSKSTSGLVGSSLEAFHVDEDNVDSQAIIPQSDSSTATAKPETHQSGEMDAAGPEATESYSDIGLVQSNSPTYGSADGQQIQNNPSLSSFSAYENQESYDAPFFGAVGENLHNQCLASSSEPLGSIAASNASLSEMAIAQQQQFVQPQQPVAQMYPQVHIPHYVPYRHIFSPVYVPPMALPNYSNNPAYPHPTNGNGYVLMPGAGSHLSSGGVKYAPSQYKPVAAAANSTGYGSYPNPSNFTVNSSGTVSNVFSPEDLSRLKYKDKSLYFPNPQAEATDIWIQTPRDLQSLQSPPYYNLSGQATHAAFMPTHAGHAFNASAQTSRVQYPGLYNSQQQAAVQNPHHLLHQPAQSGLGGSVGVGVAAPGPQVGAYQQPQLSHLNWTASF